MISQYSVRVSYYFTIRFDCFLTMFLELLSWP